MADHATALQLDTIAAGLPIDAAVPAHVQGCAECQAKLDAVKHQRAAVLRSPQFEATLQKLQPVSEDRKRRAPWGILIAIAAVLLVIVFLPRPGGDGTLLKGAQTVELMKDGAPVTKAKVGDRLTLAVGAAGAAAVAVFTIDDKGEVDVLLPSQPVAKGTRVPVGNVLEVTEGSLTVVACFGEPPIEKPRDDCPRVRLEVVP